MLKLSDCTEIVNKSISYIRLPDSPPNLYDPLRYILNLGGKRIRPALVIMACNAYTDKIDAVIYPALAIEAFHNFTLIHDDVMDNSIMRRNNPTVHVKWNSDIAILSGDALMIKAYDLLVKSDSPHIKSLLELFNNTAIAVCEGQQLDMDYETAIDVSIDDYLQMIELKTAVLIAAALKMGAIAGGALEEDAGLFYETGINIGMAFQIMDDYLDVYAKEESLGKSIGNDIASNKKTYLLLKALMLANKEQKQEIMNLINCKDFNRTEKIKTIKEVYDDLNIKDITLNEIKQYHLNAISFLKRIKLTDDRKKELLYTFEFLLNREM